MNEWPGNELGDPESWTVPLPRKLYFNFCLVYYGSQRHGTTIPYRRLPVSNR